jgi:hypothetical protein
MTSTLAILLSVLAFLGTLALAGGLAGLSLWWVARGAAARARYAALGAAAAAAVYLVVLGTVSLSSREVVLPAGSEKYFCELDCRLAYRVVSAEPVAEGPATATLWRVVVQTRFDETTISSRRPRDATLRPNPRRIGLRTGTGALVSPLAPAELSAAGIHDASTPIDQPLAPGESYRTSFWFRLPGEERPAAVLLEDDTPESRLLIGHERSPLHAKVFLALPAPLAGP